MKTSITNADLLSVYRHIDTLYVGITIPGSGEGGLLIAYSYVSSVKM